MKVLLHIGTEKTGTTTIQQFLSQNRQNLLADGYLYPSSPGEINHTKLAIFSLKNTNIQNIHWQLGLTTPEQVSNFQSQFKQDLAHELSLNHDKTVILSNEHCSSRLTRIEDIEQLKMLLKEHFNEIEIIIYLRRQDKFLVSSYSTAIRSGRTKSFSFPNQKTLKNRYDYWNILQKWESVFGKNTIIVKVFERNQMIENDLLKDFLKTCKINLDNKYKLTKSYNESLDIYSLEYIRIINNYFSWVDPSRNIDSKRRKIVQLISDYSIKYYNNNDSLISQKFAEDFMSNFEQSNQQIAAYFLNRSDRRLFYEELSYSDKKEVSKIKMFKQFW